MCCSSFSDGINGTDGTPGAEGMRGLVGRVGMPGASGMDGPSGPPGEQGLRGAPGAPGRDGINGTDGQDGLKGERVRFFIMVLCSICYFFLDFGVYNNILLALLECFLSYFRVTTALWETKETGACQGSQLVRLYRSEIRILPYK